MAKPQETITPLETLDAPALERVGGGYSQRLFSAMQHAVGMGLSIDSTWTGGHAPSSMHYKGRAFDAVGSAGAMNSFYSWAAHSTQTHELIHGRHFLKNGHPVAPIGGHDGHVHVSM